MPKFMTYQRPLPVNKARWNGKSGNPHQPARALPPAAKPAPEQPKPVFPAGFKPH
jgi:hypothetical protein